MAEEAAMIEDAGVSAAKAAAKEALEGVSKQELSGRAPAVSAPPPRKRCLYVVRVVREPSEQPKEAQQVTDEKRASAQERIAALTNTIAEKQELRRIARENVATAREALRQRGAEIRARQEVLRPLQAKLKEFTDVYSSIREKVSELGISSEKELDEQVKALESRLQHEVCSLSEEKQTVRKLETLLKSRDEIREIEYRRSAINERSAEKEELSATVKSLRMELELLRSQDEVQRKLFERYKAEETEVSTQVEEAIAKRSALYASTRPADDAGRNRKREGGESEYVRARKAVAKARELCGSGDIGEAEMICMEQMARLESFSCDRVIERLSSDSAFREEYFATLTKHNEARKERLKNEKAEKAEKSEKPARGAPAAAAEAHAAPAASRDTHAPAAHAAAPSKRSEKAAAAPPAAAAASEAAPAPAAAPAASHARAKAEAEPAAPAATAPSTPPKAAPPPHASAAPASKKAAGAPKGKTKKEQVAEAPEEVVSLIARARAEIGGEGDDERNDARERSLEGARRAEEKRKRAAEKAEAKRLAAAQAKAEAEKAAKAPKQAPHSEAASSAKADESHAARQPAAVHQKPVVSTASVSQRPAASGKKPLYKVDVPPAAKAKPKSGVVVGTPIGKALALLRSLYQYGVPLLGVFFIVIMFVMMS